MSEMICELCNTDFEIDCFGSEDCPKCGMSYLYDEGTNMVPGDIVSVDLEKGLVTFKIKRENASDGSED